MSKTKQTTSDGKGVVLGQKYRDTIHGIEGTAVACYQYLMGCDRICLEYLSAGKIESTTFDIMQLETVAEVPVVQERRLTGGPERQMPSSRDPR